MSAEITLIDDRPAPHRSGAADRDGLLEIDRFDQWTNPTDAVTYGSWCMLCRADTTASAA